MGRPLRSGPTLSVGEEQDGVPSLDPKACGREVCVGRETTPFRLGPRGPGRRILSVSTPGTSPSFHVGGPGPLLVFYVFS